MENKAAYTAVGAFVVGLTAALLLFVVWVAKIQLSDSGATYDALFNGSVTGLQTGAAVQYLGVPVGTVQRVTLDAERAQTVRVTLELPADVTLYKGVTASLEMQGLTGGVFIQLSGGDPATGELEAPSATRNPEIPGSPSVFSQLQTEIPALIAATTELIEGAKEVMGPSNRQAVADTLAHLQSGTASLQDTMESLRELLDQTNTQVAQLSTRADSVLGNADDALVELRAALQKATVQVERVTQEMANTANAFTGTAKELRGTISENRGNVREFTSSGLYQMSFLLQELRGLVGSLNRVTSQIERDPREFLFGGTSTGVRVK